MNVWSPSALSGVSGSIVEVGSFTTTGVAAAPFGSSKGAYQASIVDPTGANQFVVAIEVSNDGVNWKLWNTLQSDSASATPASDIVGGIDNFAFARFNVISLTLGGGSALKIWRSQ